MTKIFGIKKIISIICIIFTLMQILSIITIEVQPQDLTANNLYPKKQPRTSSFWDLTGTFMTTNITHYGDLYTEEKYKTIAGILIDDTLKNFTWSETAAAYPWCNGTGTKEDPYVIENVYIDGKFVGKDYSYYSNILIRHSRVHFIIRNCSLHKSGVYADWNAGIFLYNTTNGVLLNNNLTYNRGSIQLFESHNNTISFNRILSNHDAEVGLGCGISLGGYGNGNGSCDNIVENNTIINHYSGIVVYNSVNDTINRNFIKNTLFGHFPDTGIYLVDTNYSYVTFNVFAGDYADYSNPYGDFIINEQNCVGNEISNNFQESNSSTSSSLSIAQNSESWFYLENSNHNYIYGNILLKSNPEGTTEPKIYGYIINILIVFILLGIIIVVRSFKKQIINNYQSNV
ncbi:MAG: NosD domain-containing protein [Candidatus Hermodarchaeota archaeon]